MPFFGRTLAGGAYNLDILGIPVHVLHETRVRRRIPRSSRFQEGVASLQA
jgi:hypothetical protein